MKLKPVKQIDIKNNMLVQDLVNEMSLAGVMGAGKIAKAVDIFEKMIKDKDCKIFFGLAGAMVPAGMKNIIIDMLKNNYINILVTTGANLTHDLVEALGAKHYQGYAYIDDSELRDRKIDRIYDIFMKDEVYGKLEDFFKDVYDKLPVEMGIKEFLWELGKYIDDENSILRICYRKKIPIFCPAISDSGIGLMIWGNTVKRESIKKRLTKLKVDTFDDLKEMLDMAWTAKKCGIFYVGGGVPKNFIQQAMQFSNKQGADYGIQITMDRPEHGGSSGAQLKEGISWGKMSKKAEYVDVICDATIALPLIYAAFKERMK